MNMRKKGNLLALLAALVCLLVACGERTTGTAANNGAGQPSGEPEYDYTGYIVDIRDGRILVTGSEEMDFSANGGASHYYEAIWFQYAGSEVDIGQQVRVWSDGAIAESYPAQGKAKRVEIVAAQQPGGASLATEEAIRQALKAPEAGGMFPPSVIAAEYEADSGQWLIELAHNGEAGTVVITIPDAK